MAKLAANVTRLYVDEFNLSGEINAYTLNFKQETIPVTTISDDGPRRVVGNYDHDFDTTGLFDGTDDAYDERVFVDLKTDEDHYLSTHFGTAEGSPAYLDVLRMIEQPRSGASGGAVMLNVKGEGSGSRLRGMLLRSATVSSGGNGTGRNMGATTTPTPFAVHFHLIAFNGTNITIKLQESSDDGSGDAYADIAGLTSGALTAVGVVRVSTTASTEAWKRVVISGTFTSATVVVCAGS